MHSLSTGFIEELAVGTTLSSRRVIWSWVHSLSYLDSAFKTEDDRNHVASNNNRKKKRVAWGLSFLIQVQPGWEMRTGGHSKGPWWECGAAKWEVEQPGAARTQQPGDSISTYSLPKRRELRYIHPSFCPSLEYREQLIFPSSPRSQHPALAMRESAQAKTSGVIEMVADDVIIF